MRDKLRQAGLVLLGVIAGVMLSLNFSAIAQHGVKTYPLPVDELRAFADVFGAIKTGYVERISDKKLITGAINGMVSDLDPHSAYLDREEYRELQVGTTGEFGGLGIEVSMEDGYIRVISPIEDTPAFRAGIKPGDLIVKINNTSVKGMTLNDAVKRMRGKPNTSIRLTIVRKGEQKPLEITLVREIIHVRSVKSKLVEPGYGWIRITQFQERTGENLAKQIEALYKKGPLKGLVLDLRNDPGGLLHSAVAVASAFLKPDALVVSTKGRTPDSNERFIANPDDYLSGDQSDYMKGLPAGIKTVKMVVLVNGGTASASEIVSGALQDHKRAEIMGMQTFGKGSVQTILPLPDHTAIKLTTARYYTPSGRSIQVKGITPDIVVENPDTRPRIREVDLARHLVNNQLNTSSKAAKTKPVLPPLPEHGLSKPIKYTSAKDFQFQQALNYLKGLPVRSTPVPVATKTGQTKSK